MALGSTTYTTPEKVRNFMQLSNAFDSTNRPTIGTLENLINQAEDTIDFRTQNSWRMTQVTEEYKDLENLWLRSIGVKIHLRHRNVQDMDTNLGDLLEIWNGNSWEDWVTLKTEGRNNDFSFNYPEGILFIRSRTFPTPLSVRITYRYNEGHETAINDGSGINDSVTTVTVDSTKGFPYRGWIRIDEEEMSYTGKTTTTFTGLVRGAFNTTADSHSDDAVVISVPRDIEEAATKLVAIDLISNEDKSVFTPGGTDSMPFDVRTTKWRDDVDKILNRRSEIVLVAR